MDVIQEPPAWARECLAAQAESRFVHSGGARIHYQLWGRDPARRGLLLVHGTGAHSHWWQFVAPLLTHRLQVAALDLSGMGDSEHRQDYSPDIFATELMDVCEDAGFTLDGARPIICGHSLGGFMTLAAEQRFGHRLGGIILVDSPIRPPDFDYRHLKRNRPIRRRKLYPDLPTILGRFKLAPPQPCANKFILEHLARHSVEQHRGGYRWKFDDTLFDKLGFMPREEVERPRIPALFIYGAESAMVNPEILKYMAERFGDSLPMVPVAGARHHVLLDKPRELARTISEQLEQWLAKEAKEAITAETPHL